MSLTIFCRWWWFMCGFKTHLTIFIIFIRRFYVQYSTVHLIGSTVRVITNADASVITFHTLSQNNQNPHMKTQPFTAIYCTMYIYHPPPSIRDRLGFYAKNPDYLFGSRTKLNMSYPNFTCTAHNEVLYVMVC